MLATPPQKPTPARVLVADDEPVIAETLGLILKLNGFDVLVVHDGLAAVKEAARWQPHAFVSDVIMPEMDGIDAAIQVSYLLPGCRIVLISGQAVTADLQHEAALRGHDFEILPKPTHPSELLDRLTGIGDAG